MAKPFSAVDAGLVVLGAVLALGASFAIEAWRTRRNDQRKVNLLKVLLQSEITGISKILEGIVATMKRHGPPPAGAVKLIYRARVGFDRNREWIVFIEDEDLREGVFSYYSQIESMCGTIEGLIELFHGHDRSAWDEVGAELEGFFEMIDDLLKTGDGLLKRIDKM